MNAKMKFQQKKSNTKIARIATVTCGANRHGGRNVHGHLRENSPWGPRPLVHCGPQAPRVLSPLVPLRPGQVTGSLVLWPKVPWSRLPESQSPKPPGPSAPWSQAPLSPDPRSPGPEAPKPLGPLKATCPPWSPGPRKPWPRKPIALGLGLGLESLGLESHGLESLGLESLGLESHGLGLESPLKAPLGPLGPPKPLALGLESLWDYRPPPKTNRILSCGLGLLKGTRVDVGHPS